MEEERSCKCGNTTTSLEQNAIIDCTLIVLSKKGFSFLMKNWSETTAAAPFGT